MLTISEGNRPSRRDLLRVGTLGVAGLTLADVLRLRSHGASAPGTPAKSVIMVCLTGGPSHIDTYDPKPAAPVEFRGEFGTIRSAVPGLDLCEYLPLQAQIANRLAVVRGVRFRGKHDPYELLSGYPSARSGEVRGGEKWPVLGAVASRVRGLGRGGMPPYVNVNDLRNGPESDEPEVPRYLGPAHSPFRPRGSGLADLQPLAGHARQRLEGRRALLNGFDTLRREVDATGALRALDEYQNRALAMLTSSDVYHALDIGREDQRVRDRYRGCTNLLLARRLAEAGVAVVTVAQAGLERGPGLPVQSAWDTHKQNFRHLRTLLPAYDRAVSTLITDLHERGLAEQVAVVIWGEFGRTPRIGSEARTLGEEYSGGRDHWWEAGFVVFAGGGLRTGQVVGETDGRAERSRGRPYTPQNVLATLYHVLGIDPATTFPDYQGRPVALLDDREPIRELL